MNYRQMLNKLEELEQKIKLLELKVAYLEQKQYYTTTYPDPLAPPWQVTCNTNPQDAFQ